MAENSPTKTDIFFQSAVNLRKAYSVRINQQMTAHAGQDLFHSGRRLVIGIGAEVQADQLVARPANVSCARLSAVCFVQESVRKSFQNSRGPLVVLFLLFVLLLQFLGIVDVVLQASILGPHLLRS